MNFNKETKSKIISYVILTVLFLGSVAFATRYEPTKNRSVRRQANAQQKTSAETTEQTTLSEVSHENLK